MQIFLGALLSLLLFVPTEGLAQVPARDLVLARENSSSILTIELVRARAEEIAASKGLSEAIKATLAELHRRSIGALESAAAYREGARRLERSIQRTPLDTRQVSEEVERKRELEAEPLALDRLSLSELEQLLLEETGRRASLESRLSQINNQILKEQDRPVAIRQRLSDANRDISDAETNPVISANVDEIPEVTQARSWANEAWIVELRAEILMLSQELASHPMRQALLQAQQDLAKLELRAAQGRVQQIESLANQVRLDQSELAKIQAEVAELVVADKVPVIVQLAERNTRLSKDVEALAAQIKDINRRERRSAEQAKRVEDSFNATRKKIEVAGVSQILGQVLQEQRRNLPDTSKAWRRARDREHKIAQTSLSQILLEEERETLRDIDAYVTEISTSLTPEGQKEIVEQLTQLADSRSDLIEQALTIYRTYLHSMGELDIAQRRLEAEVTQFDEFLAERLLWVRSSRVVGTVSMRLIPGQLAALLAPEKWKEAATTLVSEASTAWVGFALLVAVALVVRRRHLWRSLRQCGDNVGNLLRDRLGDTVRAFGFIFLIALPGPLVLFAVSWVLLTSIDAAEFSKMLGLTMSTMAPLWFQLSALRVFAAPGSVADSHFRLRGRALALLNRDLKWLTPMLVIFGGITMLAFETTTQHWGSGLGRASFVAIMLLLALFFYRFAQPNGGTISVFFAQKQEHTIFRLRHLWFVLMVGSPLAAALLALAGFTYTAGTVIDHILATAWLTLVIIIIHQFIIRWLVLNQRKIRLQAARDRRRAEQAALEGDGSDETEGVPALDAEESQINLSALDTASRKLANNALLLIGLVGVWAIWRDMLPALAILDEITLWTYTKPGFEDPVPITVSSIGLAILIFLVMVIATRWLPAFLELTLLQRLKMSQGSHYTAITLTRYTVVAIGVAWIFGALGGSWSEIQWIFAALGVGIGFGLQEIVANFISGLIILFERPIRVGDVVSVGNTDGVVTRIRIRATTIRNWDRKELLVPNKNFITQELLNWSLSDQTTRILIRVGIAYGSNVERALMIMEEAATGHSRVMEDPGPFVVFEEFGDSALLLSLRCYIDNIDFRLRTITDLNLAINQGMADAGIEISFPQRDVHLDTHGPLDIRIQRQQPQEDA